MDRGPVDWAVASAQNQTALWRKWRGKLSKYVIWGCKIKVKAYQMVSGEMILLAATMLPKTLEDSRTLSPYPTWWIGK